MPSGPYTSRRTSGRVCRGGTHYAALIVESQTKQKYAVDGWLLPSGKEPEIVEVEKWYIDDRDIAMKAAH